jgi:hypothetical protein
VAVSGAGDVDELHLVMIGMRIRTSCRYGRIAYGTNEYHSGLMNQRLVTQLEAAGATPASATPKCGSWWSRSRPVQRTSIPAYAGTWVKGTHYARNAGARNRA